MSKLARFKKEELVSSLWERALASPTDQSEIKLANRKNELAKKVYDAYLTNAEPKYPKVLEIEKEDSVSLYYNNGRYYQSMSLRLPDGMEFWGDSNTVRAYHDESKTGKEICKEAESIHQTEDKLDEKRGQQRAKIEAAVMSLNTHKQFKEHWPEAYEVLCSLGYGTEEARPEYLPAIQTRDLNSLCNLPPSPKGDN